MGQIVPRGGVISGVSSVMQFDAWNWEDAIVREDDGVHLNWPQVYHKHYDKGKVAIEKVKSYDLVMKMSLRAWLFLKDEYPMTIPYTKKDKKTGDYILKTKVYSLLPAKRFAKGLPGEIVFL